MGFDNHRMSPDIRSLSIDMSRLSGAFFRLPMDIRALSIDVRSLSIAFFRLPTDIHPMSIVLSKKAIDIGPLFIVFFENLQTWGRCL
jgi:hypothetical protein